MAYRRTERVLQHLAARHDAIVAAAREIAAEQGLGAVQIVPVAERAGIAAGTVYRYFPAKTDLVGALIEAVSAREIAALRTAADAAPGPLSALAAGLITYAARALRHRRLAWAVSAEPVDATVDALRLAARRALAAELETRIRAAVAGGHLPEQDAGVSAAALVGLLLEGLIGPLAPPADAGAARANVQMLTLLALRALGVVDARARGLVVQTAVPDEDAA
jgi:AcrR family transcriptional regulator